MVDPIADMLTQLRNAGAAQKLSINIAHSNVLEDVANTLAESGYVENVSVADGGTLEINLAYHDDGTHQITHVRRISKPSRRMYAGVSEIPDVRGGHGDIVLSTPEGVLTGDKARQQHVGGEILFEIW